MIFYFGHCNGIKDYRVASARRPDNVLGVSSRRAEATRTIVVMPSWYGFGWRVLGESGAAAGESSEDVGEADYAIENARREVNRQLAERVAREFQARNPSRGHKAPAPVTPPSIPVSFAPPAAGMTENMSLATIQTSSLAQVGESDGAMEKLAQLARELLGENFRLRMPAIEPEQTIRLGIYMNRGFRDPEKMRISINCFYIWRTDVHCLWSFSTGDNATV